MLRYAATFRELPRVLEIIRNRGEKVIVDYAKENCKSREAYEIAETTKRIITSLPINSMCAIKLTSFGSRENESEAKDYAHSIIKYAKTRGVKICIDAEDVLYPEICYDMMAEHNTVNDINVYKTYQMYRRDSLKVLMNDINRCNKENIPFSGKLVRGAYWNSEKNDGHLFIKKEDTDQSYNEAILNINNFKYDTEFPLTSLDIYWAYPCKI